MNDEPVARTTDPDGREVVYDERARVHLERRRPDLIDQAEAIISAIAIPDHREDVLNRAASGSIARTRWIPVDGFEWS